MGDAKIKVYNLEAYSSPEIVEQSNKDWVEYGEDNDYFGFLINLFHSSPTNNAAIQGISDLIYGQGLDVVKKDKNLKGYLEFLKIFADEDVRRVCMDLKLLGAGVYHLTKSKDKKKYIKARHWPGQTIRPAVADKDGNIKNYYYSPDWSKIGVGEEPTKFAAFGFDENASESIMVIKKILNR